MKGQRNIFKRFAGRFNRKSRLEQPAPKPAHVEHHEAPQARPKARKRPTQTRKASPLAISQKGITGNVEARNRRERRNRNLKARGRYHRAQEASRRDENGKIKYTRARKRTHPSIYVPREEDAAREKRDRVTRA